MKQKGNYSEKKFIAEVKRVQSQLTRTGIHTSIRETARGQQHKNYRRIKS